LICRFAVTNESDFLGHPARAGEVIYLDLENGKRRIYERLKLRLLGRPLPPNLHIITAWQAGNRPAFITMLDEHPDVRLVVIDIWPKFRAPINRHEDRYQQDQRELQWLAAEAHSRQIAIIRVLHLIKGESTDDPCAAVGGSTAVTGNADAIYMLRRLPGGNADRSLRFIGRDLDDTDWIIETRKPVGFAFKSTADQRVTPSQTAYLVRRDSPPRRNSDRTSRRRPPGPEHWGLNVKLSERPKDPTMPDLRDRTCGPARLAVARTTGRGAYRAGIWWLARKRSCWGAPYDPKGIYMAHKAAVGR
jgi:hypothetical protein